CELLTKVMAGRVLQIKRLRRIDAQTLGRDVQQCVWARGRYKGIPQLGLAIFASEHVFGGKETVASMQRRYEQTREPFERYRRLQGVGERAFLISSGRIESSVYVQQDGRAWWLILRLKQKPRSQPPPLRELEQTARAIAARFDPTR
ncbi:MAG: hypothetical protein LC790_04275, partial [Actinobacteria bacterium]|nr:hypothetical protein [Actinomycetota bacterium]